MELLKTKDKARKILKAVKGNNILSTGKCQFELTTGFSSESTEARRKCHNNFQILEKELSTTNFIFSYISLLGQLQEITTN